MEYITFMHGNTNTSAKEEEWDEFFDLAGESGLFKGGSAMGTRSTVGTKDVPDVTDHIGGYMRFDSEKLEDLTELLKKHPTVVHGGTIEVCEMWKS